MSKYLDPSDYEQVIESVKTMRTLGEVKNLIDTIYPGWIKGMIECYSDDYPSLTESWKNICENELKVKPVAIIVLDRLPLSEDFVLVNFFAETLTRAGFCVRRKEEVIACYKCSKAIPSSSLYDMLKRKGEQIPDVWARSCVSCVKSESVLSGHK